VKPWFICSAAAGFEAIEISDGSDEMKLVLVMPDARRARADSKAGVREV
jgi:phosphosulfolactate synthase (CoM biosynthesis protein A)